MTGDEEEKVFVLIMVRLCEGDWLWEKRRERQRKAQQDSSEQVHGVQSKKLS